MSQHKLSWFLKLMLFIGLAFLYIPLFVLVIYSFNESKLVTVWGGFSTKWYGQLLQHSTILEAASDLGAGPIKAFLTITLPLSKTGIIAGSMLVFVPAVGEFVIPELVGGPENLMIGKVLWQAFFDQNNWPLASAVAVIMVALLVIPIALFHRYENREITEGSR